VAGRRKGKKVLSNKQKLFLQLRKTKHWKAQFQARCGLRAVFLATFSFSKNLKYEAKQNESKHT